MKYLSNGHTLEEAHRELGIGTTTLKRWKKLLEKNGNLEKMPLERQTRKFHEKELRTYIDENPTATLKEIADKFGGTATGAFHALKRLNITLKKGRQIT